LLNQTEVLIISEMYVWLTKMPTECAERNTKTYYVYGSGLFPVPAGRRNEVQKLKVEYPAAEVARALQSARARKVG